VQAKASDPQVRVVGLQGDDRVYFWLFDPAASWEKVVIDRRQPDWKKGVQIDVAGLKPGVYCVQWWDTRSGEVVLQESLTQEQPVLKLAAPAWRRDIACRIVSVLADRSVPPVSVSEP
jgi:hypothetical protein